MIVSGFRIVNFGQYGNSELSICFFHRLIVFFALRIVLFLDHMDCLIHHFLKTLRILLILVVHQQIAHDQFNNYKHIIMVYIPKINFKTGINPSVLSRFPTNGQYNGTQKLMLARTRIFGTHYGGNHPTGMQAFQTGKPARMMYLDNDFELHNISRHFPLFRNHIDDYYYRARKQRRLQAKLKKEAKKKKK